MPSSPPTSPARAALLLRRRALGERLEESQFVVPAVLVAVAVVLAEVLIRLDSRLGPDEVPFVLRSSVDSARALLGTIAAATITVAALVFSVTVLSVQLASAQFSPRVVRGYLRDDLRKWSTGFMVATFTYALLVLRAVRPTSPTGEVEAVPQLSLTVGVVLGVVSMVLVVAYIDRAARSLVVGDVMRRIADETVTVIDQTCPAARHGSDPEDEPEEPAPADAVVVPAGRSGWVQQISNEIVLAVVPPGTAVQFTMRVGHFVVRDSPMIRIWPAPADDKVLWRLARAVVIGDNRTMQQDLAFGIRQIVDIALRALSPAINDPTSAEEAILDLTVILARVLPRELPTRVEHGPDGRRLLRPRHASYELLVRMAFDQIRQAAADHPAVLRTMIASLRILVERLLAGGYADRVDPLIAQARLVVASARAVGPLPEDLARLERDAADLLALVGETL